MHRLLLLALHRPAKSGLERSRGKRWTGLGLVLVVAAVALALLVLSPRPAAAQIFVPDPDSQAAVQSPASDAAPQALLAQIFFEGFEGEFGNGINGWTVGDSNPQGTTAYWDDVDSAFGGEATAEGSKKGYVAGFGYVLWVRRFTGRSIGWFI